MFVCIYDHDPELQEVAQRRGYVKDPDEVDYDSEYIIDDPARLPGPNLPEGFVLRSMADGGDIDLRRELFGRSFNHPDPADWPSAFAYKELQKAPDYRADQDLFIVDPDGRYAAGCIIWYDPVSREGVFEPVGTHPDFRRLGLGREVVLEGIRRAALLGAAKVYGFTNPFYAAIGFKMRNAFHRWDKKPG